jgi:hypothetical protein
LHTQPSYRFMSIAGRKHGNAVDTDRPTAAHVGFHLRRPDTRAAREPRPADCFRRPGDAGRNGGALPSRGGIAFRADRDAARTDRTRAAAEGDLQCGDQFPAQHRLFRVSRPRNLGAEPYLGVRRRGRGGGARYGDRSRARDHGRGSGLPRREGEIRARRQRDQLHVRGRASRDHRLWRSRTEVSSAGRAIPQSGCGI